MLEKPDSIIYRFGHRTENAGQNPVFCPAFFCREPGVNEIGPASLFTSKERNIWTIIRANPVAQLKRMGASCSVQ
jgi:hypothetical protein